MMFTGIVEEVGSVQRIEWGTHSAILKIHAGEVLKDIKPGDSVAVNGVCLTVTEVFSDGFGADVMHESLNRSTLRKLTRGSGVNLERAMPVNGRFGGHMVTGHVDGVGKIIRIRRDDIAVWYTVEAKTEVMRYIVEKGSIAMDGISLTVAAVAQTDFSVSAIPHTVSRTVLQERKEGDLVNLETDIIGKYVEKILCVAPKQQEKNVITREFLSQYGF